MQPKKPAESIAVITELMMPHQVNNMGNIFGGVLMSMIDRAAAVSAMRHSGRPCVTVGIDRVDFKEPIYAGEVVTCTARITFVGHTSMEISVNVVAEHPLAGNRRHTNTCYLTFVAIDPEGNPAPVCPLELSDPEDKRRYNEGRFRRKLRLALEDGVVDS